MRRYQGEDLRPGARIAVVANDAIGNFVVGTPLLQMLRNRWNPVALDYYGGTRTWEMIEASDLIDFGYPLHGAQPNDTARAIAERTDDGAYDLVVNMEWSAYAKVCTGMLSATETFVCGPSIGHGGRADLPFLDDDRGQLWKDQNWIDESLAKRFPFLSSGFIGELFCRLAYLEGDVPRYKLPKQTPAGTVPDVLIATAASLPEKLWTLGGWTAALEHFKARGLSVGLIGAPPANQKLFWKGDSTEDELVASGLVEDLRGKYSLPEVVGALDACRLVLTIDNGVMHLAASTATPTIGLFRHGIHRLWAPAGETVSVLTPAPEGLVAEISAAEVIATVDSRLA